MGIHAAADCEYGWPWYGKLVGAYFKSHPKIQQAKLELSARRVRDTFEEMRDVFIPNDPLLASAGTFPVYPGRGEEMTHSDFDHDCLRLRSLHIPGEPLVLPNAWDVATARGVVEAGFPVVATTSGGVAAALGVHRDVRLAGGVVVDRRVADRLDEHALRFVVFGLCHD